MKQTGVALCILAPHPPLLIPQVGRKDISSVKGTQKAMEELSHRVSRTEPDVIIIVSPHAPLFHDGISILTGDVLRGDFSRFGAPGAKYIFRNDSLLVSAIKDEAAEVGIKMYEYRLRNDDKYSRFDGLDHGVLVPMHFLSNKAGQDIPIVVMGTAPLDRAQLYNFGKAVDSAAEKLKRKAVFVASGDLSHRLTPHAPAGYSRLGREFDERLMQLLRDMDTEGILAIDDQLLDEAGECGYRPVVTALGTLSGKDVCSEVLSYEGPFGVGYGCAIFGLKTELKEANNPLQHGICRSFPVELAKSAVESYIKHGRRINPPPDIPREFQRRAGVFCTLKIKGNLRGCIGTVKPTTGSIAEEIIRNAIAAATGDPRFHPTSKSELDDISYSVDILTPPVCVHSIDDLNPKVYGIIVSKGSKQGLLLPDLDGVDTGPEQLAIAKRKAGISRDEDVEIKRFRVKRYT
jgi:AmmeMemoRadiSam system protein A